jgi:hypothetical protein
LVTVIALVGFFSLGCAAFNSDSPPEPAGDPDVNDAPGLDRAPQTQQLAAYASSRYGYCDAKMISLVWGASVQDAKVTLGSKVLSNLENLADADIASGRERSLAAFDSNRELRCSYEEAGYSYEDAVLLGQVWGVDSWEAKMRIERKVLLGSESYLNDQLQQARNLSNVPDSNPSDDLMEVFLNSRYGYCDAKMISLVWGSSVQDAKVTLGLKVLSNLENLADADIASGRERSLAAFETNRELRCSYEEAGYSYEDAVLLGQVWGIDSWEAKMRIERQVLLGDLSVVRQALSSVKR